jgi:Tfp pilus assembly protein PilO
MPEIDDSVPVVGKGRKILSLLGILLLIGAVAGYAFFVRPLWSEYSTLKADVTSQEEKAGTLKEQIDSFQSAEDNMDIGTEVQKVTLLNSIPVGVNQDGVIDDLVGISKAHDIELRSVGFNVSEGYYEEIGSLSVNASFEGNYSDLINFLEGIEENSRLFKVTSINVQVSRLEDLDIKRVTFSLSMEAFYQG